MNKIKALWSEKSSRKIILFFGVIVLLLIGSLFFWKNKMKEQMDLQVQFIEQKNMLRDELDDLIDEHDELLEEYGNLNDQLQDKDSIIQNQITEIRNLIRTKEDLTEARKKIAVLQEIAKRYLSNIDSLLVINKYLTIEKDSVIQENKNINFKNFKLNKQNMELTDKVNKGSVLEIGDILIVALNYRNSGKEVETKKASKVVTIRTTFDIKQNQIAEQGLKNIYIRYLNPDGTILLNTSTEQLFSTADGGKQYSVLKKVQYENKSLPISIDFTRRDPLKKGDYLIEIYLDGLLLGTKIFSLE